MLRRIITAVTALMLASAVTGAQEFERVPLAWKWISPAEVVFTYNGSYTDADAFAVFQKEGIFNPQTAQRFRDCILSKGGTEHPMTLYKRFRGGEPTIDALLKRNGIKRKTKKA